MYVAFTGDSWRRISPWNILGGAMNLSDTTANFRKRRIRIRKSGSAFSSSDCPSLITVLEFYDNIVLRLRDFF